MKKFALTLTRGNERTILSLHDSKEEAMAEGEKIQKILTRDAGFLALIYAEFDSNNNIIDGKYKFYHGWLS